MNTITTPELIAELKAHRLNVLRASLGEQVAGLEKGDLSRTNLDALTAFIAFLEAGGSLSPAPVAPVAAKVSKRARCPFHKAIRRAYAIAKEAMLDTENEDAMRAAIGKLLGRAIDTREALTGGEWLLVGDAIKFRQLAW